MTSRTTSATIANFLRGILLTVVSRISSATQEHSWRVPQLINEAVVGMVLAWPLWRGPRV
jgi:hypothetical protein